MKNKMSKIVNRVALGTTGIVTAANCFAGKVFALSSGVGDQTGNYKNGVRQLVGYVGGLVGLGIIAFGVFNIVIAIRNEDAEGRNKALLNLVTGAALTGIAAILAVFLK